MKRLLIICGLAAVLLVPAAFAGKTSTATVSVSPSPATAGQPFVVSGCGYGSYQQIYLAFENQNFGDSRATAYDGTMFATDANGCFSKTWQIADPNTYQVTVYDHSAGWKIKPGPLAFVGLTVSP